MIDYCLKIDLKLLLDTIWYQCISVLSLMSMTYSSKYGNHTVYLYLIG